MTRLLKVARDHARRPVRSLLAVLSLALALAGLGSVAVALLLLSGEMEGNFHRTIPPNIVLDTGPLPPGLLARVAALPGVAAAEERPVLRARANVGPDRWLPISIQVVSDFGDQRVARSYPERGAWPPPDGSILLERDGAQFLRGQPDSLTLRLAGGGDRVVPLAGLSFDPGLPPSRMELTLYGHASPATARMLGLRADRSRLLLSTGEPGTATPAGDVAGRVTALLAGAGVPVLRQEVRDRVEHEHRFQFTGIKVLLAAVSALSLLACVVQVVVQVDGMLAREQRVIGMMRAVGATGGQVARDYLLGIAALGGLAGLLALAPAIWGGTGLAGFTLRALNFKLEAPPGTGALSLAVLALAVALPVGVAGLRLWHLARLPVKAALSGVPPGQGTAWAEGGWGFLRPVPRMALLAVARRPGRTGLMAVALGTGLFFALLALDLRVAMLGTVESVRRTRPHDLAMALSQAQPVPLLSDWASGQAGIAAAEPWVSLEVAASAPGGRPAPLSLLAVPVGSTMLRPDLLAGRWPDPARPGGIVVSTRLLAERPELALGRRVTLAAGDRVAVAEVVGVAREFGGQFAYADPTLAASLRDRPDTAGLLAIRLAPGAFANNREAAARLEESLVAQGIQVAAVQRPEVTEAIILGHLDVLVGLLAGIAGLALAIGVAGLASAICLGLAERAREVGVMRALGGRPWFLARLFATEALAVAGMGWALAVPLAVLAGPSLAAGFGQGIIQYPFDPAREPLGLPVTGVIALAAALVASLPALRLALRMPLPAALRAP